MAEHTLIPVIGCWVSQQLPSGNGDRKGIVKRILPADTGAELEVNWLIPERFTSCVAASKVKSGFTNGMDVEDVTPGAGVSSLGIGGVMQQRVLASSEQVLVDFAESGERHWLPYQNLRQVRRAKLRFLNAQKAEPVDAERLRLRLLAHAIETWNENTGALSHLDIDPLPHQIHLVHHILASGNYNWLIADDVGLGKTIETGMLLHALNQRGTAKRVLLITPAGLTRQWQEELCRFDLDDFQIYGEDFNIHEIRHWKMHDRVIGSLDRFKQEGHLESLMQADEWDLIIFDEGHRLSRRQYGLKLTSSDRYDLAAALRSKTKHLLLLSATPHQGLHDKFIALLELLRPERHQELMTLSLKPEILHDMIYRNHKADVTDAEGNFIFQGKITRAMRVPASAHSSAFDETLQNYLRRGYAASAAQGRKGNPIGFVMTVYRKLAASSSAAIHNALRNRLARLVNERNEVFTAQEPTDERFFGEWEEQLSTDVKEFFNGEIHLLETLIEEAADLKDNDLKLQLFVDDVIGKVQQNHPGEKVLIFTEYRTTQQYLREALNSRFGDTAVELINGSMKHSERREAIARFEDKGLFLISTEAGGEGINLQRHCHIMVNYDLPWNPMRLVQRIGRLYRYGQRLKVLVFNIHQTDTLDQQIIDLMYERIDSVVDDMAQVQKYEFNEGLKDEILGEVAELIDVEDILLAATQEGIDRTRERIDEALRQAQSAAEKQRELFAHAASGNPAELRHELVVTQDHLQSFVLGMFNQVGIEVIEQILKDQLIRIRIPEAARSKIGMSLKSSLRLDVTVNRELAASRSGVQLLDLNSPLMKYLLREALSYDFGGHIAAFEYPSFGIGAVFGAMLRWQSQQGKRMRQEFVMSHVGNGQTLLNPEAVSRWLLEPAIGLEFQSTPEQSKVLFACVESAINQRLESVSSRYLMPESLQWIAASWVV